MQNLIGLAGIVVILGIAVLFSSNRKAINLRIVGAAFALQAVVAAFVLYFDWGRRSIDTLSKGVLAVIGYSKAGIDMLFGPLADSDVVGFSFAINILPIIIFFSALMSVMYHLRIMEWVVKIVGGALHKIIGTGAIESMNAAANIFVGQTEAPLVVKPYLKNLTEPQMFAVMCSGLASIAGTVLAGYVLMGAELKYLLAVLYLQLMTYSGLPKLSETAVNWMANVFCPHPLSSSPRKFTPVICLSPYEFFVIELITVLSNF